MYGSGAEKMACRYGKCLWELARKKFDRQFAEETKRGKESMDKSKWVVNLSERRLSEEETKVLELGMKFSPAPKKIPTMEKKLC